MNPTKIQINKLMTTSGVTFGTSGARGLADKMTDEVCAAYTLAFLQEVIQTRRISRVALGMDLRPSSPAIARACAAAVRLAGGEVDFCGPIPTPGLALYAMQERIPAVMVTGSHVPFDRNGIKFYRADGEILKSDETAICRAAVNLPDQLPVEAVPDVNRQVTERYVNRYLDFFPSDCLKGMRVGLYSHSSVSRDILRVLLAKLGADFVELGRTDQFVPVDTEAVSARDQQQAREWVASHGLDVLVSTDGDGDRPMISDETGVWLRGDMVGLLCARYVGATTVVTPVSSNTAIEKCGAFGKVVRTRIGSPYVIEAMTRAIEEGPGVVAGFEANGGFLLGSEVVMNGRTLAALPTRDAILPILALPAMANVFGGAMSSLAADLPRRFTASDRIRSFASEKSRMLIEHLAATPEAVDALLGDLYGRVQSRDMTDGLRLIFENSEIVHLRPSGNAPELRCYAEADDPVRAAWLVEQCLLRVQQSGDDF